MNLAVPIANPPPFAFGWIPDEPDVRDHPYAAIRRIATADLPDQVSFRDHMPVVENQGSYSSCVAHALTSAMEALTLMAGKKRERDLSRMYVYYNARAVDGLEKQDRGCRIRSAIKALGTEGACPESRWSYDRAHLLAKPNWWARWAAQKNLLAEYLRIDFSHVDELRAALAEGFPIVFGILLHESFARVGANGVMPMPDPRESMLGRHAMALCGYNATHFLVQNSWGRAWGDKGYCSMPQEYFTRFAPFDADFWVIRKTTQA